jgi:hypothetical protein
VGDFRNPPIIEMRDAGLPGGVIDYLVAVSAALSQFGEQNLVFSTGSRVVQTSAAKLLEESSVTSTELGYLSGVTGNLQSQLDGKAPVFMGEMFFAGASASLALTDADTYYQITGFALGHSEGPTLNNDALVVGAAGHYKVTAYVSVDLDSPATNQTIRVGFGVDGTVDEDHTVDRRFPNNDTSVISFSGVVDAPLGGEIGIYAKNLTAAGKSITPRSCTVLVEKVHD